MKRFNSYLEAENYLNDIPRFTSKNPIEKTKAFYEYIESNTEYKENRLGKVIHVAGTNGKGSVCAFLDSIYRESGIRVGMFTSPHLITTRERFQINGQMVSEELFVEALNWLEWITDIYQQTEEYIPTYFERLFFMMIYIFSKEKLDVTVMETGLGGLLDTTNVIEKPVVSVITEIGFDHMAYLGNTIEEIAGQKAGIIKPHVPVVYIDRKKEASEVFEDMAKQKHTTCHKVSKNAYKINEIQKKFIDFSVLTSYYDYIRLNINTKAVYQVENAAIAVNVVSVLAEKGVLTVSKEAVESGVSNMRWPGRMEEIRPGVYIDGAHNEDGIQAFIDSVNSDAEQKNAILLFSAVNDKKYDKMIQMITKLPNITDFVITRIPGHRGVNIENLRELFEVNTEKPIHVYDNISNAFSYCMSQKKEDTCVYIVGSLYLAGIIEDIIKGTI